MNNSITQKSIRFLSQPYTLLALVLYTVNEFILQRHFPSWLSGKLSDFAWLFIAPVILTLLFSLLVPAHWQKKNNTIPLLAFTLTALFFSAIKTIPAVNNFILQTWLAIFHYPAAVVMDATDLLALLVLPLSLILLLEKGIKWKSSVYQTAIMISFFALLTLADMPAGDGIGIIHLHTYHNQLVADNGFNEFCSTDGGYHWQSCDVYDEYEAISRLHGVSYIIQIPDSQTQYRLSQMGAIALSDDGGVTWHKIANNIDYSEAAYYYQQQIRPYTYVYFPGAYDMVYDQSSGNMIIAMGLQGILVIPEDGKAVQVGIGENQPIKLIYPRVFIAIMVPYLFLAALYTAICFGTLITISRHFLYWLLNLATLLLWVLLARYYHQIFSGIGIIFELFPLVIALGFIAVIWNKTKSVLDIAGLNNKQNKVEYLKKIMPGGLAYLCCYLLWYLNIIPIREWAHFSSLIIAILWFIYCIVQSYQLKKTLGEPNE